MAYSYDRRVAAALTRRDIKPGVSVRSKDNPEWGTWQITGPEKGVARAWTIRSDRRGHSKAVFEGELLKRWEKV